mgnify:CR=1 FL=1
MRSRKDVEASNENLARLQPEVLLDIRELVTPKPKVEEARTNFPNPKAKIKKDYIDKVAI